MTSMDQHSTIPVYRKCARRIVVGVAGTAYGLQIGY
jgi:hypothetical protein